MRNGNNGERRSRNPDGVGADSAEDGDPWRWAHEDIHEEKWIDLATDHRLCQGSLSPAHTLLQLGRNQGRGLRPGHQ